MIAIIDYNAGNVRSVLFAMERLGYTAVLTSDPEQIRRADKVIFPGVGEASTTMAYLRSSGMNTLIPALTQPVLGICLGMQLMCTHSEENNTPCLGIFPQQVKRFVPDGMHKVPHMGWNSLENIRPEAFIPESMQGDYVYFVHSYYVEEGPYTIAQSHHILPFSAAMQKDNFFATQFHPEKSGRVGEAVLQHFLKL